MVFFTAIYTFNIVSLPLLPILKQGFLKSVILLNQGTILLSLFPRLENLCLNSVFTVGLNTEDIEVNEAKILPLEK